jgi:hypothetical protein
MAEISIHSTKKPTKHVPPSSLPANSDERNLKYFLPGRTQPFLITFFQAVLAFKKVCKLMRMRIGKKRQFNLHKRSTTFQVELGRSKQQIAAARNGQPVINYEIIQKNHRKTDILKADEEFYRKADNELGKFERLFRQVNHQLGNYLAKERNNPTSTVIDSKLTKMMHHSLERDKRRSVVAGNHPSPSKRLTTIKSHHNMHHTESSNNINNLLSPGTANIAQNLFHSFLNTPAEQQQLNSTNITGNNHNHHQSTAVMNPQNNNTGEDANEPKVHDHEYLEGTTIYYGSNIAIQARHGGFLSFNATNVKASAHKILHNCRYQVKKSDDLTDIGLMKFGDALWLQAGPGFVLGAQYGSLVDQKREIQPALVSCKRTSMFKAQQYGRWIVLNKDDPVGTLGKPVGHLDRVILEQEWYFLASSAPGESSMYKSVKNSDEAMTTKINLFQPGEECTWKIHLVSLPSDDRDDLKQRQQLLQEAKDQIYESQEFRYKKADVLLNSLADMLPPELKESNLLNTLLKHKSAKHLEQENLYQKYVELEKNNFNKVVSSPKFLANVYGRDSPIVTITEELLEMQRVSQSVSAPSLNGGSFFHDNNDSSFDASLNHHNHSHHTSVDLQPQTALLNNMENHYWDVAQRLLIPSQCYGEIHNVMEEYMEKDVEKKFQAAAKLQGFMKKKIAKFFSFPREFKKMDTKTKDKLEAKDLLRQQILLENAQLLVMKQFANNVHHNPNNNNHNNNNNNNSSNNNNNNDSNNNNNNNNPDHHRHTLTFVTETNIVSNISAHSSQINPKELMNLLPAKNTTYNFTGNASSAAVAVPSSSANPLRMTAPKELTKSRHRPLCNSFIHSVNSYDAQEVYTHQMAMALATSLHRQSSMDSPNENSRPSSPMAQQQYQHQQEGKRRPPLPAVQRELRPTNEEFAGIDEREEIIPHPIASSAPPPVIKLKLSKSLSTANIYQKAHSLTSLPQHASPRPSNYGFPIGYAPPPSADRPQTADPLRSNNMNYHHQETDQKRKKYRKETNKEKRAEQREEWKQKLMKTDGRDYGLPEDCFEGPDDTMNLKIGIKFLKSISSKDNNNNNHHHNKTSKSYNNLFDDIKVKKKRPKSHR